MTLTKDDLQAIAQIVDERLEVQLEAKLEEKLEAKLDAKLEEKLDIKLEEKLDAKLETRLAPIMQRLDRLEEKTDDLQTDMVYVKKHVENLDHMLKSEIVPRLKSIEECYVSTYDRYRRYADGMDSALEDVDQLKRVAADHSRRLQRIEAMG